MAYFEVTGGGLIWVTADNEDEGIAEALRRDAELEANPSLGMSLEQLDRQIESRRN